MQYPLAYSSPDGESFEKIIGANCKGYFYKVGYLPQVVQISKQGRFNEHIGDIVRVEFSGAGFEVLIVGGTRSEYLNLVGTLELQGFIYVNKGHQYLSHDFHWRFRAIPEEAFVHNIAPKDLWRKVEEEDWIFKPHRVLPAKATTAEIVPESFSSRNKVEITGSAIDMQRHQ